MRKLIDLIRRFWNLILFIILEVICFVLIAKTRNFQGVDLISSSNAVVGYFYKKQNDIVYYFQLRRLNDSLLQENTRLNEALAFNSHVDTFTHAEAVVPIVKRDSAAAPDTVRIAGATAAKDSIRLVGKSRIVRYARYNYIPARVIKNSISNDRINFITLNRGAGAGIKKGMAVVTGNGIVGRVTNVSEHFATVASILSDRKVSARLHDGTFGFILWEPGSPERVVMDKMPLTLDVEKGDSIFTTGYSFFPENLYIGRVYQIDTVRGSNTKNLKISLSTNFRKLQYVYVVENEMGKEQANLEAKNLEASRPDP